MREEEMQSMEMLIDDTVGQKILNTAIEIINHEGYENLTIRRVAKESGCSNSAIYQRFGDKNALASAAAAMQAEPFLVIMDEVYSDSVDMYTNMIRIADKVLDKLYLFKQEAVNMQIFYHGRLGINTNPFILRIEEYLKKAVARGEANIVNTRETAFVLLASFLGAVQMIHANGDSDLKKAKKLLEIQLRIMYSGMRMEKGGDSLWDLLRERGVDVDKALERMKGNKDAYRRFLMEFFADPDFDALGEAIETGDAKNAFAYAHGLKGIAANLGLDEVRGSLSALVEILRPGKLDGAQEAYNEVLNACGVVTVLL